MTLLLTEAFDQPQVDRSADGHNKTNKNVSLVITLRETNSARKDVSERAIIEDPNSALQYGDAKQRRNDKQIGEAERVELVLLTLLLTEADEIPYTPAPSAADQKFGIAKSRQETLGEFKIEQYRYDTQPAGVRWHCVSAASATLMLRHSCGGLCLYD